jgi:hypothetical protein
MSAMWMVSGNMVEATWLNMLKNIQIYIQIRIMIDHTVGLVGNGCGIYLLVGNQKSYSWLNAVG